MVWSGAPLFPVYFLWWRRIWLFIVLRPEGNYCVLAPCGEIVLCLALSGWNPGLFILACWEEKEIDYWMTCMTLAEEEKFCYFLPLLKTLLKNCTVSSSCQQGSEWIVTSFYWERNMTGVLLLSIQKPTLSFLSTCFLKLSLMDVLIQGFRTTTEIEAFKSFSLITNVSSQ